MVRNVAYLDVLEGVFVTVNALYDVVYFSTGSACVCTLIHMKRVRCIIFCSLIVYVCAHIFYYIQSFILCVNVFFFVFCLFVLFFFLSFFQYMYISNVIFFLSFICLT